MPDREYDVVVVGGSLAGCAAARLLALRGARVAVVEKRPELDAYKVICTHNIQASAVPAMERLGIMPAIHDAGAVSAQIDIWTRYGWIRPPDRGRRNVNLLIPFPPRYGTPNVEGPRAPPVRSSSP